MCSWFIVPIRHDCSGLCSWVMAPHVEEKMLLPKSNYRLALRKRSIGQTETIGILSLAYARGTNWSKKLEWTFCFPFSSTCGFNGSVTQYRIKKRNRHVRESVKFSLLPHTTFPPLKCFSFCLWTFFFGWFRYERSSSRSVLLDGKWPKTPPQKQMRKSFLFRRRSGLKFVNA